MKWRGRRESDNVEDRRGAAGPRRGGFGFPFPGGGRRVRIPMPQSRGGRSGGIGIFGLLVMLGLMWFFGIDPRILLGGGAPGQMPDVQMPRPETRLPPARRSGPQAPQSQPPSSSRADEMKQFISVVLADTEDTWRTIFSQSGKRYQEPTLVLFQGGVRSSCGVGMAQMGPFYCPLDQKLYIDLSFYSELKNRFGAPGDFAQAYVIAHEVGHHVQTLLGISEEVQRAKMRMGQRDANALQVRMELQADCLAGVWAKNADRTKAILEPGDIDEALNAASAIGDDKMQRRSQGYVVPDGFTHGSSEQRVRWFRRGFETGDFNQCDTFSAPSL
jgi:predicted metalloprotease